MWQRMTLALLVLFLTTIVFFDARFGSSSLAQEVIPSATLKVGGAVTTPLVLTIDDLKKMPRKTISVVNFHEKKTEVYDGVLVEELLKKAGVPQGEHLHGLSLSAYIVFEAEDGYRVVFSIAELDSGIVESGVMVADTMDGKALPPKLGPFRLVAPLEKRPARWVRMLKSITVVRLSAS
ncbi:MAG TPA: molybdopterin-dependent oxidoreductase [Candidatus Limnocylindrales bacterium]|nr:molybdopterin-dependent oxidoreductase [Candidatus Limnocylindrales bacterium]